jgi:dolichol-phosphate mannosyltransferase
LPRTAAVVSLPQPDTGKAARFPSSMRAVVVIPTYKERENLPELLELIWKSCPDLHVLIADDFSGDGAPNYLKTRSEYGTSLFVLERRDKQGLARAYLAGFDWALQRDYTYVLQMDADLSHDPLDLPKLLEEADRGTNLVLGSRYYQGVRVLNWEISRLLLSLGASFYVRFFTRMPFTDPTGGFKCYRAGLLRKVVARNIVSQGYAFQIETLFWAWMLDDGIVEVPIIFGQRKNGASKMSGGIAVEASWQVVRIALMEIWLRVTGRAAVLSNDQPVSPATEASAIAHPPDAE